MSVEKPTRQDYRKLLVDGLREDDDHIELIKYLAENGLSEAEAELKLDSCDREQIENLKTKILEAEQNKDRRQLFLDELRINLEPKFNTRVVDQIIENFKCEAVYFLNELDLCNNEFDKMNLKFDLLASLCKEGYDLEFNNAVKYIEDLNSKKNNPDSSFKQKLIDELTEINLKERRFKNKLACGLSESDKYIREGIEGILAYVNTANVFTHSNTARGKKPEITKNQIALICIYNKISITRENALSVANEYGCDKAGQLYQNFSYFSFRTNRVSTNDLSDRELKNKIELFNHVIRRLSGAAKEKAQTELNLVLSEIPNSNML